MKNATDRKNEGKAAAAAPAPIDRLNTFGRWCAANGLGTPTKLGAALKKPRGQVWRWTLPPEDPESAVPRPDALEAIFALTGGAIEPNHFYAVEAWRAGLARKAAA